MQYDTISNLLEFFYGRCFLIVLINAHHHPQSGSVNIRIVVMNNLLPSSIRYHEKYDLKGSTYKRKASGRELDKKSPTFKDLDFIDRHEEVGVVVGVVGVVGRVCGRGVYRGQGLYRYVDCIR